MATAPRGPDAPPAEVEPVESAPPTEPELEPEAGPPAKKAVAKKAPARKATAKRSGGGGRRGSKSAQTRASGETAAREEADSQGDGLLDPAEATDPIETSLEFSFTNFHRVRTRMTGDDLATMQRIHAAVDERVFELFTDAFDLMNQIWSIVRQTRMSGDQPVLDHHGFPVWERTATGAFVEDWTQLTYGQREHFLYVIVTNQFVWEQRAASLWTEAMFSKAMFTEHFAHAFDEPAVGTVDDRNARGNIEAAEDRYFALFVSALSKKADAVVKSMDRLERRLSNSLGK